MSKPVPRSVPAPLRGPVPPNAAPSPPIGWRGGAAAGAAVYLLVAFEFFYMASPFAGFFYSAYVPGLQLLQRSAATAWLLDFFLPHCVVETSSSLIDSHNLVGAVLTAVGLGGFAVSAGQVYYSKLRRGPPVTTLLYRHLRHPQYVAFAVAGLGLLLLWPRYLALVAYVLMLAAYRALAVLEEGECVRRYGASYAAYAATTGRFWPRRPPSTAAPLRRSPRLLAQAGAWFVSLALALGAARGLELCTLDSLFARYEPNGVYLSVVRQSPDRLAAVARLTQADDRVQEALRRAGAAEGARFVTYVLPTDWFISEIPMHIPAGASCHATPGDYDPNLVKAVMTIADLDPAQPAHGRQILDRTRFRQPVIEVWLDLAQDVVTRWQHLDHPPRYPNVPVPVY